MNKLCVPRGTIGVLGFGKYGGGGSDCVEVKVLRKRAAAPGNLENSETFWEDGEIRDGIQL